VRATSACSGAHLGLINLNDGEYRRAELQLYGGTPAVCFGPMAEAARSVDARIHVPSLTETTQEIAPFIGNCGLAQVAV
jgi:hypothetical protein